MKITSVEPQKKNPKRFNIFLGGKFGFGADVDTVVSKRLVVGREFSEQELEEILLETEVGKLMERVYKLLVVRARSEKEIRDYFRRKNIENKVKDREQISELLIDLVVERLKQKGLLNDEQFARDWVEARRKSKHKGKIALKMELFQKGIDSSIVDEALVIDEEGERLLAEKAIEKKLRVWRDLEPVKLKRKVIEYLMRRGFEYQVALGVVVKMLKKEYNAS